VCLCIFDVLPLQITDTCKCIEDNRKLVEMVGAEISCTVQLVLLAMPSITNLDSTDLRLLGCVLSPSFDDLTRQVIKRLII